MTALVLNPRRKRRKGKSSRRGKMPAGLARYWAKKRRKSTRKSARRRKHSGRRTRRAGILARIGGIFKRSKRRNGRRARNTWPDNRKGHRQAALKGWRGRRNTRRRHRNPGMALRLPGGRLLAGVKPAAIMGTVPVAAGAIANLWLTPKVASYLPAGWQSGIRKSVVGLLSAGGIAAVSGVAAPRFAAKLAVGAVAQTVIEAAARMIGGGVAVRAPAPVAVAKAAKAATARVAGFDGTWAPEFEGGSGISGFEYLGEELEETFN